MKRILAALILFAASTAWAFDVPVRWPDGRIREGWPKRIGAVQNPTPETCEAEGYELVGVAEVAAQEAADAAAQAQAEEAAAAYADPQPAVFVPRFSGSITNVVGLSQILVDDATDEPVVLDETGSPEHTIAQKEAQNAERGAARAAWLAAMIKLKTSVTGNVADATAIAPLAGGFTAAENRATVNDLRRELIDLTKDVRALRRQLAKYGKLDDEQ